MAPSKLKPRTRDEIAKSVKDNSRVHLHRNLEWDAWIYVESHTIICDTLPDRCYILRLKNHQEVKKHGNRKH